MGPVRVESFPKMSAGIVAGFETIDYDRRSTQPHSIAAWQSTQAGFRLLFAVLVREADEAGT
jgi:hypothetical protein